VTPGALDLAEKAMGAAAEDDWPRAVECCEALGREYPEEIGNVLLAWIDTGLDEAARRAGIDLEAHSDVLSQPVLVSPSTGEDVDIDSGPPELTWAMRLIAARVSNDRASYETLLNTSPVTPEGFGAHVGAVLQVTAHMYAGTHGARVSPASRRS
jgi:hypothetical protein